MKLESILQQFEIFKNIVIDQILFEATYPVLFTGRCHKTEYLFICYSVTSEKMRWIATNTSYQTLIDLLQNKITIRNAFLSGVQEKVLLEFDGIKLTGKILDKSMIPQDILPTPGEYMDADDGEFDEEIGYYRSYITTSPIPAETIQFSIPLVDNIIFKIDIPMKVVNIHAPTFERTFNLLSKWQCTPNENFKYDGRTIYAKEY